MLRVLDAWRIRRASGFRGGRLTMTITLTASTAREIIARIDAADGYLDRAYAVARQEVEAIRPYTSAPLQAAHDALYRLCMVDNAHALIVKMREAVR
jgi:hypothetical protein